MDIYSVQQWPGNFPHVILDFSGVTPADLLGVGIIPAGAGMRNFSYTLLCIDLQRNNNIILLRVNSEED